MDEKLTIGIEIAAASATKSRRAVRRNLRASSRITTLKCWRLRKNNSDKNFSSSFLLELSHRLSMDVICAIALQPSRPEHVVKFPFSLVSGFLNGTKGEWKETNFLLDAPALNPSHSSAARMEKSQNVSTFFHPPLLARVA